MANKNPPAHDFAPAWLKIPTYNSYKPSGASSERGGHTSRRDEHSFGFTRHKESDPLAYHSYFNECRKDRDDYEDAYPSVNNVHYYGMDNGFNGCNNQALLSRRPHSRHDFRISLSYAKADAPKHMTKNGSGYYHNKGKGKLNDNGCVSNNGIGDGRGMGVTSNNFNQEFPSLQGDISEEPSTVPALNGSAWEKPRNIKINNTGIGKKIQLVKKPVKGENSCESSRKSPASSSSGPLTKSSNTISSITNPHTVIVTPVAKGSSPNCRALIPAKSTVMKKPIKETLKITNKKSSTAPAPSSHSMEILVKHPKAPGNKSEFLKALRNETKEQEESERDFSEKNDIIKNNNESMESPSEEPHVNGIDISKLSFNDSDDREKSFLSSSLEAEERLLREMGWKEEVSDDENYAPLTEDELREFQEFRVRSETEKKSDAEKVINKNGIRRPLLANLSPLRLAPFPSVAPPTENTSSSSDSEDDS
ncbi:vasculin isoform X2 [Parasteatoda tepidariorum]|uniref:vasculin isoform X2 n=1 Tax=Parasteatoda tepidariorum TaxID=114398 RepID=UPI001C72712D|nr:vasculin isoform X2 [Parasteatoda tepidariorum]